MADNSAGSCRASRLLTYEQALTLAAASTLVSGIWLCAADRRLAPGVARLAAAAPVVLLNTALPLLFCRWEEAVTIFLVCFNASWLSNFKALAWAANRGALCMQHLSAAHFLAVYAAPITPAVSAGPSKVKGKAGTGGMPRSGSQGRLGEDAGGLRTMLTAWAAKNALVVVTVYLLSFELPGAVESFVCGLALYALLSMIMDGPAALIIGLTGLRVSPHFDQPWKSTSVASFWSKRWDLAAGNTLRQLVYDSVVEGSLLPPAPGKKRRAPSVARQALGTAATFAASGLIHEAVFWYITGRTTAGVWFTFFFIQAPIIFLERAVLAALKRSGVVLPGWLRTAVTTAVVVVTGQHLFWAPSKQYGINDAIVGNTRQGVIDILRRFGVSLPL